MVLPRDPLCPHFPVVKPGGDTGESQGWATATRHGSHPHISGPSAPQSPCKMGQDSTATTKSHTADPKGAPLATETGPGLMENGKRGQGMLTLTPRNLGQRLKSENRK